MIKTEKVYSVTFMQYTNYMKDTVSDWDGVSDATFGSAEYLNIGKGSFLVRESELEKYRKFGQGYRDVHFVGNIEINNEIPPNAHWEINPDGYYPYCSHCKEEPANRVISDYCPKCGAKMDNGSSAQKQTIEVHHETIPDPTTIKLPEGTSGTFY